MTAIFIIIGLVYFIMRGVVEGIIMVLPNDTMYEVGPYQGPRSHIWFRAYHLFALIRDAALIAVVWLAADWVNVIPAIPALLLLGWEMTEIMYSTTRYARTIPNQENVFGLGWTFRGASLAWLHTARITGGILLLVVI